MRRRLLLLLLAVVVVALGVTGWAGYRALQVRQDLTQAQAVATSLQDELRAGRAGEAEGRLPALKVLLDRAAARADGPVWAVAEHLPVAGRNLHAIHRTARAAQLLGDAALPEATAALNLVRAKTLLRAGKVDLPQLAVLRDHVDKAAAATAKALQLLAPGDEPLFGTVRAKVALARVKVNELDGSLQTARKALDLAPAMLGTAGPRHYFVAVQNSAEARATGGLIGAFALVTTDHGAITLDRTGTDADLHSADVPVPSDPKAAAFWRDLGSSQAWFDANLTPHFPDAARNIAGLWKAQSGQQLDGVLALDPVAMGELLKATGPVTLPDGTSVSAGSVADFVGHDEYVRYTDNARRKALLGTLASDLFHQVVSAKDAFATMQSFAKAGSSGHLLMWSGHAGEQDRLGAGLVGGALPTGSSPYLQVLTQDFGGDKLAFYLRRTVRVTRAAGGRRQVQVTLRNSAPEGLPAYMTVRSDGAVLPYGQAKVSVSVYGAVGSAFDGVTVDGQPALASFDTDQGHRFASLSVEVPRGRDVVATFSLSEPAGVLLYRQQPLVAPDVLDLAVPHEVRGR